MSSTATDSDTKSASSLSEPGDHKVDVSVTCVLTRFGLRHSWQLLPTYLGYRLVVQEAACTPGLLRAAFLIENWKTCYSLSIWESPDAIPVFGTQVVSHINVANRVFGRLANHGGRGPELWSTKWILERVSSHLNWEDFDLRMVIEAARHAGKIHEPIRPGRSNVVR